MKKILILYTSVGEGHKKIAENIGAVLSADYEVDLVDTLHLEKGKLVDKGAGLYLWILNRAPWLWDFFYNNKLFLKLTLPLRVSVAGLRSKKALNLIRQKKYDIVLTTQVNPSAIVSYLKKKKLFMGKFVIAFSDYHLHPYWVFKNADLFLANIKEQKEEMQGMGIPESKIAVCGITLKPKQKFSLPQIKEKLKIGEEDMVVLFSGGSLGVYLKKAEIEKLRGKNIKIIIVCGKNKKLFENMREYYSGSADVAVFGYYNNMEELYAVADILVGKPGGLTVAECLRFRLPMQINACMPGQEKLNYKYLLSKNLVMPLVPDISVEIKGELESKKFRNQLGNNPALAEIFKDESVIKDAFAKL